ncbi:MAG: hypothetical protein ACERKD_02910 [Prolixibacteraceae bacterium]
MKILGGNQVVFYASCPGNLEIQLTDCLEQLEEYMDEKQIYPGSFIRHNLFVRVDNWAAFEKSIPGLEKMAKRRFPLPMIINIIPIAPAMGDVALESTHIQSTAWNCLFKEDQYGSCQHLKHGKNEAVIGSVKVNLGSNLLQNVEQAFETMDILLAKCGMGFQNLVKQWNYIERMLEDDLGIQRYQIFNDIRTKYYDTDFEGIGFPASTEIGLSNGGILIEFFAIKGRDKFCKPLSNPLQKAPHEYSAEVLSERGMNTKILPTTPKVERAQFLTLNQQSMIFVTATPAVVGERTTFKANVKEQLGFILENYKKLLTKANLEKAGIVGLGAGKYSLVKVYVRNEADFPTIQNVLVSFFPDVSLVLVQADLPRKDFLLEIEAEIIF